MLNFRPHRVKEWEFDAFLSYNRSDSTLVEHLAKALRERGLRVFKDDWYLRPGEHWPTELESKLSASAATIVTIGRNGLGPWQKREAFAALDQQISKVNTGEQAPPVIPVLLEKGSDQHSGLTFLRQNVWVEAWDPRAADLIAGAIHGIAPSELYSDHHPDPRAQVCPYRGLSAFREEDASVYFGREVDVRRLIKVFDKHPLVAVVGASGSGKSSLVRAGLIPQVRHRASKEIWQVIAMTPGSSPFLALARQLLPLREPERYLTWSKADIDDECDRLKHRLERDGAEYFLRLIDQCLEKEPGTSKVLLLIDQWEELYTNKSMTRLVSEPHYETAHRFIRLMAEALNSGRLQIVLTLRADYWNEVLNDQILTERLPDDAVVHLRPLDREDLERMIQNPAETIGLEVPEALLEVILADTSDQPGYLPLLGFALQELWSQSRQRDSHVLSLAAYRDMGGLEKAIVSRADEIYDRLNQSERDAIPGVFAALVHVDEIRTDLRRRARLAELSKVGQDVARRLADERILVTSRDWTKSDDFVEVAHEALLRHWPRLESWVLERRNALLTIRKLQEDVRIWLSKAREASLLWSHEQVHEVVDALAEIGTEVKLTDDERTFLGPINYEQMLAELEHPETDHARRALIGERLDVLGDHRSGIKIDSKGVPEIDWCDVKGGEIGAPIERRLRGGTRLAKRVVQGFRISRNVITVDQYRAFLEASNGWRDTTWWANDLYRDPDGRSYNIGEFGNHPVTYVSWFDAMAFCRWLGECLSKEIRLPDGWEWQQAASGSDADRTYPWGNEWDPEQKPLRANTFESLLGGPTAVGMYPAGASTDGAMDLVGNVWEWCLNKHFKPKATKSHPDDVDPRVVRGGSWSPGPGRAQFGTRSWNAPVDRFGDIGFRIVCRANSADDRP